MVKEEWAEGTVLGHDGEGRADGTVPGHGGEGRANGAVPGTLTWRRSEASTWRRSEAPMWRCTQKTRRRARGGGGCEVREGGCVAEK
jgi:hypothetical protein